MRPHAFCTAFGGMKRRNTPVGKQSTTEYAAGQRGRLVSLRKVVTEITIETNQVLVIKRKQVTRSMSCKCASEVELVRPEFVQPDTVKVLVNGAGNQQGAEEPSNTRLLTDAAHGSHAIYLQSLLGATRLAKRFLNCLGPGSKPEDEPPRAKDQKSKDVDRA
jgi:hypothetical protein